MSSRAEDHRRSERKSQIRPSQFCLRGKRAIIEICFIIFLFYANLLMEQYLRTGGGQVNGFAWAVRNIFTVYNFFIGTVATFIRIRGLRAPSEEVLG
jgi:hypothetical protein